MSQEALQHIWQAAGKVANIALAQGAAPENSCKKGIDSCHLLMLTGTGHLCIQYLRVVL